MLGIVAAARSGGRPPVASPVETAAAGGLGAAATGSAASDATATDATAAGSGGVGTAAAPTALESEPSTSLTQLAVMDVLPVSAWFDAPSDRAVEGAVMHFSGHLVGSPEADPRPASFTHAVDIEPIPAGAGRVSVTAKVRSVAPGEWDVHARLDESGVHGAGGAAASRRQSLVVTPAAWSWRRWSLADRGNRPVHTCLAPFARAPGVTPFIWAPLVLVAMIVAVVVQQLVNGRLEPPLSGSLPISLIAITAGLLGAKVWFVVLHRRERRYEGWCIQGFLTGVVVGAVPTLWVTGVPAGAFLDVTAPGLLLGLAIGRVGCFFAGCCAGRPTGSRWGLWSSDQTIGVRRMPTQLLEAGLCLGLAGACLAAVLLAGTAGGGVFVAGLAVYTLLRQQVLRLRTERRQTSKGTLAAAVAAGLVLVVDLAVLAV